MSTTRTRMNSTKRQRYAKFSKKVVNRQKSTRRRRVDVDTIPIPTLRTRQVRRVTITGHRDDAEIAIDRFHDRGHVPPRVIRNAERVRNRVDHVRRVQRVKRANASRATAQPQIEKNRTIVCLKFVGNATRRRRGTSMKVKNFTTFWGGCFCQFLTFFCG